MPLAGIVEHRRAVAAVVRREQRMYYQPIGLDIDIDVSIFECVISTPHNAWWCSSPTAEGADKQSHRKLACEARADLWRHMRADRAAIDDDDQVQIYEEWSHTE